jgi:hypothetical protein
VQNVSSSNFLSKNLKMKIYTTLILLVVVYGCETWSGRSPLGRPSHRRVDGTLRCGMWVYGLDQYRERWQELVNVVINLQVS